MSLLTKWRNPAQRRELLITAGIMGAVFLVLAALLLSPVFAQLLSK